jgi:hypothetical protein
MVGTDAFTTIPLTSIEQHSHQHETNTDEIGDGCCTDRNPPSRRTASQPTSGEGLHGQET